MTFDEYTDKVFEGLHGRGRLNELVRQVIVNHFDAGYPVQLCVVHCEYYL